MFDDLTKKLALTAAGALASGALLMGASAIASAAPPPTDPGGDDEPTTSCYGISPCPVQIPEGYGGYWAKDGVPAGGFANGKGGGGGFGGYWGKDGKPAGGYANNKGGGAWSHEDDE